MSPAFGFVAAAISFAATSDSKISDRGTYNSVKSLRRFAKLSSTVPDRLKSTRSVLARPAVKRSNASPNAISMISFFNGCEVL
jgi:hypothetical protein